MSDCGCKENIPGQTEQKRGDNKNCLKGGCLPGDFCRNHYYTGKLLTARNFQMEQDYFRNKQRMHNLALHGWGVVCGLWIEPHPLAKDGCHQIVLNPGMAIDSCGREIRVRCEREFALPKPPKDWKPKPCHDDEEPEKQDETPDYEQRGEHGPKVWPHEAQDPSKYDKQFDPYRPEAPRRDERVIDLYVCLGYRECKQEYGPAPFDECGCDGPTQQPNSICDEYELTIHSEQPQWWDDAFPAACGDQDCTVIWERARRCNLPGAFPCVPLAVIHGYIPGEPLAMEMIENVSSRLLLPSVSLVKEMLDCIIRKLPLKDYTVIEDFNWTHDDQYDCNRFLRAFATEDRAFEITFSRPLNPNGISKRSFQLSVVLRDKNSEPRLTHVVPAEVKLSEDRRTVRVEMDRQYAKQFLDRHRFDLYIKVYCDKLIDENGDVVDGNLLARRMDGDAYVVAAPTGNGAPGGIFDSWIRVR
ncbi:MAG: hypothetical protein ACK6DX_13780 [Acidobacteriota bacterium]